MIRTLVVEESGVARLGIRSLLGAQAKELEIDEAASIGALLERLAERYYEHIIVEPALCPGMGITFVRQLREDCPWAAILVFTGLDELSFGVEAIHSGAKGYLMKTCGDDEFRRAVKRVGASQLYLSNALAAAFAKRVRSYDRRHKPHDSFSQRLVDDCRWTCGALWSGRYDQGCVASPAARTPAAAPFASRPYAAIQSARSAAMMGLAMR